MTKEKQIPAPEPQPGDITLEEVTKAKTEGDPPGQQSAEFDAEAEAIKELKQHTYNVMIVMLQRHRKGLKQPSYTEVLNVALSFKDDVDKKINHIAKALEAIGVNVDQEFPLVEAELA